ncbi:hypothetical protein D9M70_583120 [compost metagenome]
MPGDAQTRAAIFLDALTGDLQLRCLLGLIESPSREERQRLIDEAIAIFIRGLSPVAEDTDSPVALVDGRNRS